jgi:hypothetical protein
MASCGIRSNKHQWLPRLVYSLMWAGAQVLYNIQNCRTNTMSLDLENLFQQIIDSEQLVHSRLLSVCEGMKQLMNQFALRI